MNVKTSLLALIFLFTAIQIYHWLVLKVNNIKASEHYTEQLIFVHIGKTGGSTIRKFLNDNTITYRLVHCQRVTADMIHNHSKILISIRDPLERIISAFNWRSPVGGGIAILGKQNSPAEQVFYQYFPNSTSFISVFSGTDSSLKALANKTLQGSEHVGMGYSFYLGNIISLLSSLNFAIIRQDKLLDDLIGLESWIGKKYKSRGISQLRSSYRLHNSTNIHNLATAQDIATFKSVITREYEIYHLLLNLARKHPQLL